MDQPTHETWKPVPGYESTYEVSDLGRVRSLLRQTRSGPRGGRVRKLKIDTGGYYQVNLSQDGKTKYFKVSVLVLLAFTGPRPPGLEACHKDGDQKNDAWSNLEWGTKSQNTLDQVRHGTHWEARMTECPRCHGPFTIRKSGKRYCQPCDYKRACSKVACNQSEERS